MTKYEPRVKDLDAVLKKCETLPGEDSEYCMDVAKRLHTQYEKGDEVYPWVNSNWSYRRFAINKNDPIRNGMDTTGSFDAFFKNVDIGLKQVNSLISDPNPSNDATAGVDDQQLYYDEAVDDNFMNNELIVLNELKTNWDNDPRNEEKKNAYLQSKKRYISMFVQRFILKGYKRNAAEVSRILKESKGTVTDELNTNLNAMQNYEKELLITPTDYARGLSMEFTAQQRPYDDPFFNKPTTGEHSSSYFQRNGYCMTDEKTQAACEAIKGRSWIGNHCYRGKYVYLDNSPRLSGGYFDNLKGLVPSTVNDIISLNPSNFMGILQGYNVPGMDIQKCTKEVEGQASAEAFVGNRLIRDNNSSNTILITVPLILALIIIVFYCLEASISKNI